MSLTRTWFQQSQRRGGVQTFLHGPNICQGSSQGDVQVHGQVKGDLDLSCPPRPLPRKDFLSFFACLFWGLAGLELQLISRWTDFPVGFLKSWNDSSFPRKAGRNVSFCHAQGPAGASTVTEQGKQWPSPCQLLSAQELIQKPSALGRWELLSPSDRWGNRSSKRQTDLPRLLVGLRAAGYHSDPTPDPCATLRQEGSTTHRCPINDNPASRSSYTMTQVAPEVKNLLANAGDLGLIPGWGRSPAGGNANPPQYCLKNRMDRGAWRLQSTGSQRVGYNRACTQAKYSNYRSMQ